MNSHWDEEAWSWVPANTMFQGSRLWLLRGHLLLVALLPILDCWWKGKLSCVPWVVPEILFLGTDRPQSQLFSEEQMNGSLGTGYAGETVQKELPRRASQNLMPLLPHYLAWSRWSANVRKVLFIFSKKPPLIRSFLLLKVQY